jgi:hypothetical protein
MRLAALVVAVMIAGGLLWLAGEQHRQNCLKLRPLELLGAALGERCGRPCAGSSARSPRRHEPLVLPSAQRCAAQRRRAREILARLLEVAGVLKCRRSAREYPRHAPTRSTVSDTTSACVRRS